MPGAGAGAGVASGAGFELTAVGPELPPPQAVSNRTLAHRASDRLESFDFIVRQRCKGFRILGCSRKNDDSLMQLLTMSARQCIQTATIRLSCAPPARRTALPRRIAPVRNPPPCKNRNRHPDDQTSRPCPNIRRSCSTRGPGLVSERLESAVPERWMSGLSRTPGKRVRVNALRGFESPSLRQFLTPASTSPCGNSRTPSSPIPPMAERESEAPARFAWGFERPRLPARPRLARERSDRGSRPPQLFSPVLLTPASTSPCGNSRPPPLPSHRWRRGSEAPARFVWVEPTPYRRIIRVFGYRMLSTRSVV